MQTVASVLKWSRGLLIASLYVSMFGCATPPTLPPANSSVPVAQAPVSPIIPLDAASAPSAVTTMVPEPEPTVVTAISPANGEAPIPHIALLLPLNSPTFAKAADAVKQGFLAAASMEKNGLQVRLYPFTDENTEIPALYKKALLAGAVAVAGPLTRNGVNALAVDTNLKVPTLALNSMDTARTDQLYFFGLPAEAEARQAAQRATAAGVLSATIISTNTPLSKRLAQAFSDEWQREGGIIQAEIVYNGDPNPLKDLPMAPGSSVFLAAELDKARLIRPYIDSALPVYSTSQVFSGNTNTLINYDLTDVRFVDMPWMLQPDHPAVMIYPHVTPPMTPDMERLYALGVDAYRLLQLLFEHNITNTLPLDGVTGKINLVGHQFQREGITAIMRQGQGVPIDSKRRQ